MSRPRVPLLLVIVLFLGGLLTVATFAGTPSVEPRATPEPTLVEFGAGEATCAESLPDPYVTTRQENGTTVVDLRRRATLRRPGHSVTGTLEQAGPATYVLAVTPTGTDTASASAATAANRTDDEATPAACTARATYDATVQLPHRGAERFTLVVTHEGRLVTVVANDRGQATVTEYGTHGATPTGEAAVTDG